MLSLAGAALLGLLAPAGRGDDHSAHRDKGQTESWYQPRLRTYSDRSLTPLELLQQPPARPYRSAFYFPKDPPARPKWNEVQDVYLTDDYFSPYYLMIPIGTTVRFTNRGRHHHTTTCDWLWESGEMNKGASFSITFSRVGRYYYYCRHHRDMRGVIDVY